MAGLGRVVICNCKSLNGQDRSFARALKLSLKRSVNLHDNSRGVSKKMGANEYQLWFRSDKFEIVQGEDAATNPQCYGKDLANWLRNALVAKGYQPEEVIAEDWGWLVMCSRKPFSLWVGCTNVRDLDATKPDDDIPLGNEVVWSCMVIAEQSFMSRILGRADTASALAKLFGHVQALLNEEAKVTFVEQP